MHKRSDDPRSLHEWRDDQLGEGMDTNQACIQCHDEYRDVARLEQHTHHSVGSTGSLCYNCHMSYTSYGLLKAIRSHQIDQPSMATSLETGRPNACNQCHLDKTMAWTAEWLHTWYGTPKPELSDDERRVAAAVLWLLRGDAGQRALMAWSLGWEDARDVSGSDWIAPYLIQLFQDPYLAIQFIANRSLRRDPCFHELSEFFGKRNAERTAAQREALEIWRGNRMAETRSDHDQLLLDAQGNVKQVVFDRLLGERDDRPITLVE